MTEDNIVIESSWGAVQSVEDMFLRDLPEGVTLLPRDWEGETTRVYMKFAVSEQAISNKKFDLQGFIKAKFDNTLKAIRQRRHIDELRLARRLHVIIDPYTGNEKTMVHIHIEYAKE